jgi:hypothetical protein
VAVSGLESGIAQSGPQLRVVAVAQSCFEGFKRPSGLQIEVAGGQVF